MQRLLTPRLMYPLVGLLLLASAGLATLWGPVPRAHASSPTITEYPIPTAGSGPGAITAGPDGNLWFLEVGLPQNQQIGKITTGGSFTEYPLSGYGTNPYGITAGPDGNVWFTEGNNHTVGKITPGGTITLYDVSFDSQPRGITAGPDGNLWFIQQRFNSISKITTAGVVTGYPIPTANSVSQDIAAGPDGNLWFTENGANQIGKITTTGVVTEYPVPTAGSGPYGITAGPDGNLWFTENNTNNIGKITPAGVITEYPTPATFSRPGSITAGPDGNLWFVEQRANQIGQITTGGVITEYPTASSGLGGITAGPDGNLWFTDGGNNAIAKLTPPDADLGLTGMPANITTNATSPNGAVVTYTPPTATDESGDNPGPSVSCSPASGSTFPIGTTTVTCTATDSDDSNSPVSGTFTVTVNDTDLGLSGMPANITTNATSPSGAVVTYTSPTAIDESGDTPPATVSCNPASGSTFPVGKTTVTCTASDSDDTPGSVSATFTVTVKPVLTLTLSKTTKPGEGALFSGTVASGVAYGTANPLTATIIWGDGSTPDVITVTPAADGSYSVAGSHTYAEDGSYSLTVVVSDHGRLSATRTATVKVADAALLITNFTDSISGRSVTQSGIFTDADPGGTLSDYSASINWGDGTTTPATLAVNGSGPGFTTQGSHTYGRAGTYTVTLTITDAGGSKIKKTVSVTIR